MNWQNGNNVPSGWNARPLAEITRIVGGGTPKTTVAGNFSEDEGHAWITPSDLTDYRERYVSRGRRCLTDQGLKTSSATYMPAGTVLFSSRAPIGYVAIASAPVTTNQGFRSFLPSDEIEPEYLYHALRLLRPLAEHLASGTTFAELSGTKAGQMVLAYPTRHEQREIVKVLDLVGGRRDVAATALRRAGWSLQNFRQAVLANAYETAVHRVGATPLSQVIREPLKNGYSARPVTHATDYKVLTLTATTSGYFDATQFKYTDEALPFESEAWVQPGDIFVQRGNTAEYVGVPAIYDGQPYAFIYPDLMIRVRPKPTAEARFLWYMLMAPQSRTYLREHATGSAGNMPKINQKTLSSLLVPLPPQEVQLAIVRRVDALLAGADKVSKAVEVATDLLDKTDQAVLAKAFRGELSGISIMTGEA